MDIVHRLPLPVPASAAGHGRWQQAFGLVPGPIERSDTYIDPRLRSQIGDDRLGRKSRDEDDWL